MCIRDSTKAMHLTPAPTACMEGTLSSTACVHNPLNSRIMEPTPSREVHSCPRSKCMTHGTVNAQAIPGRGTEPPIPVGVTASGTAATTPPLATVLHIGAAQMCPQIGALLLVAMAAPSRMQWGCTTSSKNHGAAACIMGSTNRCHMQLQQSGALRLGHPAAHAVA